jgi:hypothetical protein
MTTRTLVGLAAALVVLALLALYGQRRDDAPSAENRVLLPEIEAAIEDVDRVAVVGAGNEPIATLVRRENAWVVSEKDGYPADVVKIRQALLGLAEARVVEQKTGNPEFYDRLGVQSVEEDNATGLAITPYVGDSALPTVIVGDVAGTDSRYVRRADEAESNMVNRALDIPRDAAQWVDPSIVDIRSARVQEVTIEHPDGETVRVSKDNPEQTNFDVAGIPEDRELLYPGVANVMANALRELSLEDVESANGDPTEEPVRTTFRTFDGLVVTVSGVERDEEAWIELQAAAAPSSSEAAADSAAAEGSDAATETDAPEGSATSEDSGRAEGATGASESESDPVAEAASINDRVEGWRYRIPTYQFDQMTRRMSDLLKAEEESAPATE